MNAISDFSALFYLTLRNAFRPPFRRRDLFKQLEFVAVESAPVILISIVFASMVTILEASYHMKLVVKNDALVPGFAGVMILREIGSVVTSLLLTARVGAGIAAEISTMKVTDQLDALKLLGLDPVRFLVVPRFLACVLGGGLICLLSGLVCLFAAMIFSDFKLGYPPGIFMMGIRNFVHLRDLGFLLIKGMLFGGIIPLFACHFGFRAKMGADGVGTATTQAVVSISIAIIIMDFFLTWCFSYLY